MKVGVVVPGGVDPSGERNVIPAILWLLERLAREHDVHVFALGQTPVPMRYELRGTAVTTPGNRLRRARTISAILAEHRRGSFDVVHAFWAATPGLIAGVVGRLVRRPVVLHVAGGELVALPEIGYGGQLTARRRVAVAMALRSATRVTAASAEIVAEIAARGYRAERVTLGVDLDRWPLREPRARAGSHSASLLYVGSLNEVKDPPMLLRAAAVLRGHGVRFHLDIVGEDTLHGEIQRLATAGGLREHVCFHGFLPQRELRPLVERADLLIVSSRHEAGPVVVLEAAVAGVPTVGTAVGHVRDWAPDAAVAVRIGDHDALAAGVEALLADDERRLGIARRAQANAVAEDADHTANRFESIYRALTANDKAVS